MPQITIKGLTDKQMRAISTPLIPKLAEAIGCPEDWLILELAHSSFYAGGEQVPGFPIVEVSWFAPMRYGSVWQRSSGIPSWARATRWCR